jgi:ubiquitin-protein ligase
MAALTNKRILTEITKLQGLATNTDPSSVKYLLDKSPADDETPKVILGRIFPKSDIYNQAAFQIEIKLPTEYPFKAPEVFFNKPIYHPNVDDKGEICVDILNADGGFKPRTSLTDIVKAVVDRIDNPNIDHALNPGKIRFFYFFPIN